MYQPCHTCPFREKPVEAGSIEWVTDLMKGILNGGLDHSCHLTDPKADLYGGQKKRRPCFGFLGMMKAWSGGTRIGRRAMAAIVRGKIDWEKVPSKGIFRDPFDAVCWHAKAAGVNLDEVRENVTRPMREATERSRRVREELDLR